MYAVTPFVTFRRATSGAFEVTPTVAEQQICDQGQPVDYSICFAAVENRSNRKGN
ncbi:hypothetical protein PSCLAVI8L_20034 [Pseudoclavibacter sp. 8L]|nr:hypothetical protein PSCLAVI8L_20034 [Pseudoclavibacter sp. 8L]